MVNSELKSHISEVDIRHEPEELSLPCNGSKDISITGQKYKLSNRHAKAGARDINKGTKKPLEE